MDPELEDESSVIVLLRYVNIGLLCVQESAKDRPTMPEVVSMLMNQTVIFHWLYARSNKRQVVRLWTRVRIIEEIAQGLLYLHEYSRLRIIHRDLKANTKWIVGTYFGVLLLDIVSGMTNTGFHQFDSLNLLGYRRPIESNTLNQRRAHLNITVAGDTTSRPVRDQRPLSWLGGTLQRLFPLDLVAIQLPSPAISTFYP
ncbi:hypothetical protein Patl1_04508 [Pistacia atlantica]|uniref:Uncharacterized protein n=1 Tax=Pistacia atlantica TaxID=434234 RepID=A0ACC1BUV9_9ROSI|nr:hypothetical protein Patl1_04508 [Pistacia atlantica]